MVTNCERTEPSLNQRLFYWAVVSALAGFLFGFDTVVISGAEKTIQSLWFPETKGRSFEEIQHDLGIE